MSRCLAVIIGFSGIVLTGLIAAVSVKALDVATRDRLDMTGLLRRLLVRKAVSVSAYGTNGQWGEIDSPEDVALYQNMVRKGELILEEDLPSEQSATDAGDQPACHDGRNTVCWSN